MSNLSTPLTGSPKALDGSMRWGSMGRTKNRFETYVKAKDLDLWHIILNGDFPPLAKNEVTQILEVVPFEEQSDDLKKKLAKNNEAKMVLYNALPKNEYERILCVKRLKIFGNRWHYNLEWIAIGHWLLKNQRLSSLALDELIGNLKVHEVVMEKDSEIYKGKKVRIKSIALKAKKESSNDETSTSKSDDEEYAMAVCLRTCLEPDEWIKDSGCSKHITGNKSLFSTYKAYDGGSSIIAIRTDHGQEFDNEVQFGAYCDALGITHNFSALRTPQSNG
ncbi:zf-CCHC domain-containing protein [Tanacetum coccineum]